MKKNSFGIVLALALMLAPAGIFASVDEYQKAVQLDGNNVVARFNLGLALYQEQKYDDAIDPLRKALEINTEDKGAHSKVDFQSAQLLGIIYFEKNSVDDAINFFKKAGEINPADGNNYYYLGLAYKKSGKPEEALKSLLKALDDGADNPWETNFRIGQIYYEKKEYGGALEYFEKVVSKKPDYTDAREYLGDIYDRRDMAGKAVENYLSVVKSKPNNIHAQYQLGLNYFKQKEYDKMIAAYKKTINIDPNFADAHYNLGMAYYYRNMYEDAISEFQTAIKLNPNDASSYSLLAQTKTTAYEYHKNKGSTFLTADDYLQARDEFQLAMNVKQGDEEAQRFLDSANAEIKKMLPVRLEAAKRDFEAKKYSEAYNDWDFVLKADPGNSEAKDGMAKIENNLSELVAARVEKAKVLENGGNLSEALAEYSDILKIAPKSRQKPLQDKVESLMSKLQARVKGLLSDADSDYSKKSYKKALGKYSEVLKYDANNSKALNGITRVNSKIEEDKENFLALAKQNKSSNEKKAVEYYKKVVEMDPNNEEANKGIVNITGKQSSVSLDAQKVKSLYYEGVDKYVNGEVESAIKIWKKVLAMDPGHVEAQKNIKRAEEKLQAIKSLSR
jgi:tetratricopeptide (TPR) repeat protein